MTQPTDRRKGNGGPRPGAGRPPIGDAPRTNAQFQLDPGLRQQLKQYASAQGVSQSQVINELLEKLFSC